MKVKQRREKVGKASNALPLQDNCRRGGRGEAVRKNIKRDQKSRREIIKKVLIKKSSSLLLAERKTNTDRGEM